MLANFFTQPQNTRVPRSKSLENISVKQTLMISSDVSSSTNNPQHFLEPLPSLSAQLRETSRTSLCSTQQLLSSVRQVTFPALVDYTARLSGAPLGGKQVAS